MTYQELQLQINEITDHFPKNERDVLKNNIKKLTHNILMHSLNSSGSTLKEIILNLEKELDV